MNSPELLERMVRGEEELRAQRGLIGRTLDQMEKRFEQMDRRFDQVDKRFEQVDKRFEQVDRRLDQVDRRFVEMDRRFGVLTRRMDRFMFCSFGTTVTVGALVVSILHAWPPG